VDVWFDERRRDEQAIQIYDARRGGVYPFANGRDPPFGDGDVGLARLTLVFEQ
jgi:hypothetical protein